jgi:aminoglycoside 3-N-acetyltransferase
MWPLSKLPRKYRIALRAKAYQVQRVFVRAFLSYDAPRLVASLRALGIKSGDTVLLHSGFDVLNGFRGTIATLTNAFLEAIGPDGNLLMVSLPYRSSSLEYLKTLKCFDVRKTPSMMGLVSEFFRRRPNVLRSLHPTHPMLAFGPDADWIVADHELCRYPCGPGTPFEKLVSLDAKAVFFNVPFDNYTFFHNLEHLVSSELPFALYTNEPFEVPVIDKSGETKTVTTFVFSLDAIRRRKFHVLEDEMRRRRMIRKRRVGNSYILSARLRDSIECVLDMSRRGHYFYDLGDAAETLSSKA